MINSDVKSNSSINSNNNSSIITIIIPNTIITSIINIYILLMLLLLLDNKITNNSMLLHTADNDILVIFCFKRRCKNITQQCTKHIPNITKTIPTDIGQIY